MKQFIIHKKYYRRNFSAEITFFSLKFNIIRPLKDYSNIIFHLELYVLTGHEMRREKKAAKRRRIFLIST